MLRNLEVNRETEFRSSEEEVVRLLEECSEIRRTLRDINSQLTRIESRVKRAFPTSAARMERHDRSNFSQQAAPSREEVLSEFDNMVRLVASGARQEAERIVERKSSSELLAVSRELGVSFPRSKPSIKAMRDAIFGKVRESVLLSRHSKR